MTDKEKEELKMLRGMSNDRKNSKEQYIRDDETMREQLRMIEENNLSIMRLLTVNDMLRDNYTAIMNERETVFDKETKEVHGEQMKRLQFLQEQEHHENALRRKQEQISEMERIRASTQRGQWVQVADLNRPLGSWEQHQLDLNHKFNNHGYPDQNNGTNEW